MVKKNFVRFFKKYGYYVVGGILLIAIGVTLMSVVNFGAKNNAVIDVSAEPLSFTMPMNELTVVKEYSDTQLIYNATLNQWEAHKAYSLTSANLNVYAVARGTVSEVGNSFKLGNYVVITHEDGLKSVYGSLSETVSVKLNDVVEKGQLLGTASTSASTQTKEGNHLHFEMYKDNVVINPSTYLNFESK